MTSHAVLFYLNVLSVSLILANLCIMIFDKKVIIGSGRKIVLFNMSLGLLARIGALCITMILFRSNG